MDGPVATINPLNDADINTVWIALRKMCENVPQIRDASSLCQALLTNKYPRFSANAIKMVCSKFNITDHKIARAVIKQVCERKNVLPPRPPNAASGSPRLSSDDTRRMLLALRNIAPATGDFSSFCNRLLSSRDPTLLARAVELICRQFYISDENIARGIIKQLCERYLTKPPTATSATPTQRVTLSDSDAERVWGAIRNEAPATVDDSMLCKKLLNNCASDFYVKVLKMVGHKFRISDSGIARAVIRQVCTRKFEATKAAMRVKPDACGLMPPVPLLHVFRAEVRTNGRVTTNVGGFRPGQSMLKLENGNIYGFLKPLKKSLTGYVTKWQKMRIVPDRPHPVAILNAFVTIKCVEKRCEHPTHEMGENPHRELRVQSFLSASTPTAPDGHPNICRLIECGRDSAYLYAVMEFMGGPNPHECPLLKDNAFQAKPNMGEFFDIVEHNRGFSEPVCRKMFIDVLQGARYMLRNGIAHCDLSLENTMVAADGTVKHIDFGLCTQFTPHGWGCYRGGKPAYLAPETLQQAVREVELVPGDNVEKVQLRIEKQYGIPAKLVKPDLRGLLPVAAPTRRQIKIGRVYRVEPSEVWSLGIMLFTMAAGNPLCVNACPGDQVFDCLKRVGLPALIQAWQLGFSRPLVDLLHRMLALDPSARPKIEDLAKHAWLRR